MKSLYNFIVKPYNDRYNNKTSVEGKELIVNSNIENHEFISKKAVVVYTPAAFKDLLEYLSIPKYSFSFLLCRSSISFIGLTKQ
jgi:hypothetical protein